MKSVREIIRYSAVGVVNTISDFTIFSVLYYLFGVHVLVANTLAFLFAVSQSYVLNKTWTFREYQDPGISVSRPGRRYFLFIAINMGGLCISNTTVYLLVDYYPALIAKIAAAVLVLIWGFFLSRRYVFQLNPSRSN